MAARSMWKGFVRFGLVSIPVKAYSAAESGGSIALNQLHRDCGARIRYKKTCPEHGEVQQGDIVSGYQYARDQYVIIDTNELDKIRTPQEKAVDIVAFIEPDTIDPVYYSGRTLYLVPDGTAGFKPYALLAKVMGEEGRFGFAKVVMGGKDQIVVVRSIKGLLVMTFLNFATEVRGVDEFLKEVPNTATPSVEEMKMARALTEAMEPEDFDFAEFKDTYNERLTDLIQRKIEGKEIVTPPSEELRPVPDLMEALRASVAGKGAAKKRPAKLAAPSKSKEVAARRRKTS